MTSAALLAAGGLAIAPSADEPVVLDAPAVASVEARVETEPPPPLTLLPPPMRTVSDAGAEHIGSGEASYYGAELAGNPTASGERFDPSDHTAAHRTLPFGTRVRVTSEATGESVIVRINDRGPFAEDRVIDLSTAAAREIGMTRSGTADVTLERLPERRAVRG